MSITRKLTVALGAAGAIVLALYGTFAIDRDVALYGADVRHDHEQLGKALAAAIREGWATGGETEARAALDQAAWADGVGSRFLWADELSSSGRDAPPDAIGTVASGRTVTFADSAEDALITWVPIQTGDRTAVVEIDESLRDIRRYEWSTAEQLGAATLALGLLYAAIAGTLGEWLVGRPARGVIAAAGRFARGDFSERISPDGDDELARIAKAMDSAAAELAAAREAAALAAEQEAHARAALARADRLATVGTLAAGVAHELGTPLQIVALRARLIADGEPDAAENAKIIEDQCRRMTRIVREVLDFARARTSADRVLDIGDLVMRARDLLAPVARARDVSLEVALRGDLAVPGDPDRLHQALANLVINAVQASPAGSTVRIAVEPEGEKGVIIKVVDQGPGIPASHRDRVFEPFFTTKDVGEGTGLGLSIAWGIIRDHGGRLTFETSDHGTTFLLHLPAEPACQPLPSSSTTIALSSI